MHANFAKYISSGELINERCGVYSLIKLSMTVSKHQVDGCGELARCINRPSMSLPLGNVSMKMKMVIKYYDYDVFDVERNNIIILIENGGESKRTRTDLAI